MFGKGVSYSQQVPNDPPRKVILVPGNSSLHQTSSPIVEQRTFSLLLGEPSKLDLFKGAFRPLAGRFYFEPNTVQGTWPVFDINPELYGQYYLRVEEAVFTWLFKRPNPLPIFQYDVQIQPIVSYNTIMTSPDLTLTYDKIRLQHAMSMEASYVFPVQTTANFPRYRFDVNPIQGQQLWDLAPSNYAFDSIDINWNPNFPQVPNVQIYFEGADGVPHTWRSADPSETGRGITLSGFQGYPLIVQMTETGGLFRISEEIIVIADGVQEGGTTLIQAKYVQKQPFVPSAPMMVDRVRDNLFMRQFQMSLTIPFISVQGAIARDVDFTVQSVKIGLYPVGARIDTGGRS
jgi:hypothetical protein